MKIDLGNQLFIESDTMQFIIKKYTGKFDKEGNGTYKVLGYFSSIKSALKHLVKVKLLESDVTTVKELIVKMEEIEKEIEALVKE